jgi:hypothetical protein
MRLKNRSGHLGRLIHYMRPGLHMIIRLWILNYTIKKYKKNTKRTIDKRISTEFCQELKNI